jgi:hypothetical protein
MLMKHLKRKHHAARIQIKTIATCLENNYLLQYQTKATAITNKKCNTRCTKKTNATSHAVVLQHGKNDMKHGKMETTQ